MSDRKRPRKLRKQLVGFRELVISGFEIRTSGGINKVDYILAGNGFDMTLPISNAPLPGQDAYVFNQAVYK